MKMNSKKITALLLSAAMLCGLFAGCAKNKPAENVTENTPTPEQTVQPESAAESEDTSSENIEETDGEVIYYGESYSQPLEVAAYIYEWEELPPNYITKSEAEKLGWQSNKGNLWDVAYGSSIGGDRFGNREGLLPQGEEYRECDVNYQGGYRGGERIVYSIDDYDIYYTDDHYESFSQMYSWEEGYIWEQ